jgi:hypothetical protein
MTFEEMQTILAGVVASQATFRENQAEIHASQATFRENMELMRQDLANTQAIANSNARAIEATANEANETKRDLTRLVNIIADFVQATNSRLGTLEDRQ